MLSRSCYATLAQLKTYLTSALGTGWTGDDGTLLLLLLAVSERIDRYCGFRSFTPVQGTRTYLVDLRWGSRGPIVDIVAPTGPYGSSGDSGSGLGQSAYGGTGITEPYLARQSRASRWLFPDGPQGGAELSLDAWLLAATQVTLTAADGTGSPLTLAAGASADYELLPPDEGPPPALLSGSASPAGRLRLTQTRANALLGVPQQLALTGTWGYQDQRTPRSTLAAPLDSSATTFSVPHADAASLAAGMTLWCDTEQLFLTTAGATDTPTCERGVGGTLAAAHLNAAPLAVAAAPSDVSWAALELARNRWRERDAGQAQLIGNPMMGFTRPGAEEQAILRRLDSYLRPTREAALTLGFA